MERHLVFRDEQGHSKEFTFAEGEHLKFTTAFGRFWEKYLSDDNTIFRIERLDTDETLILETEVGIIGIARGGEKPETSYQRYNRYHDGVDVWLRFAHSGWGAIEGRGEWVSDREGLLPDASFRNLERSRLEEKVEAAEHRRKIRAMPKLDKKLLNRFCKIWADTGYNAYDGRALLAHVLFDSHTLEEVGEDRAAALTLIEELGLEVLPTPEASLPGEIWVRGDSRVDLELGKW